MDIITNQSRIFRRLVKQRILETYRLKRVTSTDGLKHPVNFYSKNDYFIIHNSVLNHMYKTNLQGDKFSIVIIMYKNMTYSKKVDTNNIRMDSSVKKTIKKIYTDHSTQHNIGDKIYIIARKYINSKDKNERVNNCFGILCSYDVHKLQKNISDDSDSKHSDILTDSDISDVISETDCVNVSRSVLRRRFLRNLKNFIGNLRANEVLKNSIFIDTEFTNDIYDDFTEFPVSYDTSILFMIGMSCIKDSIVCYHNFTVNRLDTKDEKQILENFLQMLSTCNSKLEKIPLIHWSNAEKYIIEKTLSRYPDLVTKYKLVLENIIYIDLLKIVRLTIPEMKSYSLKYVCKYLLDISYDTDCKNGLDAMCSVIKNNIQLQKEKTNFKTLMCFDNTRDVVNYNKLDTTLLYSILRYFVQ